jgi:hypothetical protein
MERTETAAGAVGRPRPWLLVALGVAVALYAVMWLMPGKSAAPSAAPSKPRIAARTGAQAAAVPDVRLEALKQPRSATPGSRRNPFRFYEPPPPPAPPPPVISKLPPVVVPPPPDVPSGPVGPPPPPKISLTLKYMGLLEGVPGKGKVAAFSDCRATMRGSEGDIIDGRYRLVRIGVESVVMEYPDGRGRETIRQSGQDCVTK